MKALFALKWFLIVFLAVFFTAISTGSACAADPKCNWFPAFVVDPDPLPEGEVTIPPADVINATGPPPGSFEYCTPTWDHNGLRYPLAGYAMACEVRRDDLVLDRQEGLAPGQLVSVTGLTLRWNVDAVSISCFNVAGEGEAWVRPAIFPASPPGAPYVPSD
jgi:hypothetical protein